MKGNSRKSSKLAALGWMLSLPRGGLFVPDGFGFHDLAQQVMGGDFAASLAV